jgi:pimeloyl-ACP methyl ester carboxylesterase
VAGGDVWIGDVLRGLTRLGFSSLVLDYRGVGRSGGARDSRQLPADAAAAWGEALRRAGSAERIVLRAMSLGTLAAASLIERGIRPGAVILIAPLRARTVAAHWVRARRSWLAAFLSRAVLREPLAVDQDRAISRTGAPLLLVVGSRDELLFERERRRLVAAALGVGGLVVERDLDHRSLMRAAHGLLPEELALYRVVASHGGAGPPRGGQGG